MNAEIVITGLCSILNPTGKNNKMGDPAFIAVQTKHKHESGKKQADHHIAYIAFDSTKVNIDDGTGFHQVPKAKQFLYLPLDGQEISIVGVLTGTPKVDQTYLHVVRKDDYWPDAKDKFNRDYVPHKGSKPNKTAVKAWMRFGAGRITAGRISRVLWEFAIKTNGKKHIGNFAEEVVYSNFLAADATELVIALQDLDAAAGVVPRTLRFTPVIANDLVTVIVGNNVTEDMAGAVKRIITTGWKTNGKHFKYLNAVADPNCGVGPIPTPKKTGAVGTKGGGENSGPCGPGSGND